MTHSYKISGMTCTGCQAKVEELLKNVSGVKNVKVDLAEGEAQVEMNHHVTIAKLQEALSDYPKYTLSENVFLQETDKPVSEESRTWFATYKPVLLILGYITMVSLIAAVSWTTVDFMLAMRVFMAGFFLVFSFFKMLDLQGFANSYAMYDIVAKRIKAWGYIYAFVELGLGIAYATGFQ
ncbi:MAG: heavy-metal-associated protein, partial [Bacteroidota bacterium]|nr:heavy-metal-associated protein [Bacteroidota bacterium]